MRYLMTLGLRLGLVLMVAIAVATLGGKPASAQEDNNSAPPPLQFPTLQVTEANGVFGMGALRSAIQQGANAMLCILLTREKNPDAVFDDTFTFNECDPDIAFAVNNNLGSIHWLPGARPMECGGDCMSRPMNDQTRSLDLPNRRFASVRGRLTFRLEDVGPTLFDRDVNFPLEVRFECRVQGALKVGELLVTTVVGQPFSDEPGIDETIFNILLFPLEISRQIDNRLRAALGGGSTSPSISLGRCTSIGAHQDPVNPQADGFTWFQPPPAQGGAHPPISPPGTTAMIVFDSIVRNQTLEKSPPPAAPLQFVVYVNGSGTVIPRTGTITLSPGGRHDQKYCKTVNVEDAENLQILFVDSLGGTVWSQFPRVADFGNGPVRRMTTGRQYFEPPTPIQGVPQPPGSDKPQSFIAREFEVQYHIVFEPSAVTPPTATPAGPAAPTPIDGGVITTETEVPTATPGGPTAPTPVDGGVIVTSTEVPPAPTCIKI